MAPPRPSSDLTLPPAPSPAAGPVTLVIDGEHLRRVVLEGMLKATTSLAIATADFKAMLVPTPGGGGSGRGNRGRDAPSIVTILDRLARRGVEVRVLHSGVPSGPALHQLRKASAANLVIRRCPRLHAKAVIVDCRAMYLGSANLTGAGLGAKSAGRRNFEMGVWTESTALIDPVLEQFDALWEGRRCDACQRRDVCPVPLEEPNLSSSHGR